MTSLTIVSKELSVEEAQNYADWLLTNGWKGTADKILINNKPYWEMWKNYDLCVCGHFQYLHTLRKKKCINHDGCGCKIFVKKEVKKK